jgi:hypothetical protein
MKWHRLIPVMLIGALLLGSMMVPLTLAQSSNTLQENVPGSLLVFPIFDVIGANQTKIRITNNGSVAVSVHLNYICQPLGTSITSNFCPLFDEVLPLTNNQTIVLDVGTQISGACPTGQGFIVAWAEAQCSPTTPLPGCQRFSGLFVKPGEFAPISFNQLYGSYQLFYNGSANPPTVICGGVPCSPLPTGPFPDVEAANAIAIQSPQLAFSFLGLEFNDGILRLGFTTATLSDYVALPKVVQTDFATPGAALIAGPPDFPPFISPDTVSGTELQTNIILLNLNLNQYTVNADTVARILKSI